MSQIVLDYFKRMILSDSAITVQYETKVLQSGLLSIFEYIDLPFCLFKVLTGTIHAPSGTMTGRVIKVLSHLVRNWERSVTRLEAQLMTL